MLQNKKPLTKEERRKLPVRIIALLLAVLMVAGMAYYTIYILASSVGAADAEVSSEEEFEIINTSSLKDSGDVLISVGLMYGTNLTTGFQTTTADGYTVGIQNLYNDRDFDEIWNIDDEIISCTADANLSKTGMTFLIAENRRDTVVGGYHIQIDCDHLDREEFEDFIADTQTDVKDLGLYVIPSYIYTGYAIRIGDFSSKSAAEEYLSDIEDIYDGEVISIVSPAKTAVSVLDPYSNVILFEFDCGGEYELGLTAHEDEIGNTYITTPAGNNYDGVFCFKRYNNGETDGVSLINVLPLEAYIAGVLPYETSNTWPLETLKAFAITVRSYTLTHLKEHLSAYGFDLCNSTDCQVYKGAGRVNDRVMEAVLDTAGKVMTYDDKIVTAYYSSSMGGVTVSAQDAWGGVEDYPYLQAVETPWENYMVHNNAFWITEISPEALLERLHTAGYDKLEDEIESVEIIELAKNSTYVKTLRIADIHGNAVQIQNTDKVRTSLTPYVKSANFVVGRGEVEYTENVIVNYVPEEDFETDNSIGQGIETGYLTLDDYYVITEDDLEKNSTDYSVTIMTGDNTVEHNKKDAFVITRNNASAFLGDSYLEYAAEEKQNAEKEFTTSIVTDKTTDEIIYKIAYAEDEDNFIFVGKGWGHGVGMSQYGARDLAGLGYSAEEILSAYFVNTEIMHFEDTDDFN